MEQKKEKKIDPGLKYIYKEATLETDDYNVYIIDAVAVGKQVKFKIKIFNKTNDYLLIKPNEINYVVDGKTVFCRDKNFVVQPNEEETEVEEDNNNEWEDLETPAFMRKRLNPEN